MYLDYLQDNTARMLDDLESFVSLETPSGDKALLDRFSSILADYAAALGGRVEIVDEIEQGNHVVVRWNCESREKPAVLLGHYDTVWPIGTLDEFPLRREGTNLFGPGCFDMKAGLVQGFWAVRAYRKAGGRRPIVFVINSDEESGSPSSQSLIKGQAKQSEFVLVLEPSDEGNLKTARRGVAHYRIDVHGRASHAGLAPELGVSAIDELCRLALELKSSEDVEAGTNVNIGVIGGGTRFNVVPEHAHCEIDVRAITHAEASRMHELMLAFRAIHRDARVEVSGGSLWPPMERTVGTARLAEQAMRIARSIGFELGETLSGGASDGCHCAAVGAAVLDGLGAVGGGAHGRDEHVVITEMPLRSALVAGLLATVSATPSPRGPGPGEVANAP